MMLAEPLSPPSWSHHPYGAHAFFVLWFCRLFTYFLSLKCPCGIEVQMPTCVGTERAGTNFIFWGLRAVLMKVLAFGGMTPCRFVLRTKVTFQRYSGLHWRYRQWSAWNVGTLYKYIWRHTPENWPYVHKISAQDYKKFWAGNITTCVSKQVVSCYLGHFVSYIIFIIIVL